MEQPSPSQQHLCEHQLQQLMEIDRRFRSLSNLQYDVLMRSKALSQHIEELKQNWKSE